MEIRQLETFVHVAQLQSFSRAAEVLGYTQSAITVQIRLLENELETRLFDRTGKRVVLTPSGKEFMGHASRILYDVNKAKKSMNDDAELKNPLHIGTIESLCTAKLPAVLSKFREFHPKVNMQVTIDTPEQLIRMMEHNGLDLNLYTGYPKVGPELGEGHGEGGAGSICGLCRFGVCGKDAEDGGYPGRAFFSHGKECQLSPGPGSAAGA